MPKAITIHQAVYHGNFERVKQILEEDPKAINALDATGMTPLHVACWLGPHNSAYHKDTSTQEAILQNSPNHPKANKLQRIIDDAKTMTPSMQKAIIKLLIQNGADVNALDSYSDTPLIKVAYGQYEPESKVHIAEILLYAGAKINSNAGTNNKTALFEAAMWGNDDLAQFLLKNGANVNLPDFEGNTMLHRYLAKGENINYDLVDAMLAQKADLNLQNHNGETVMHIAAEYRPELMGKLIKCGGSLDVQSKDDLYPLEVAELKGKIGIILDSEALKMSDMLCFGGVNIFRNPEFFKKLIDLISSPTLKAFRVSVEDEFIRNHYEQKHDELIDAETQILKEVAMNRSHIKFVSFPGFDLEIVASTLTNGNTDVASAMVKLSGASAPAETE